MRLDFWTRWNTNRAVQPNKVAVDACNCNFKGLNRITTQLEFWRNQNIRYVYFI